MRKLDRVTLFNPNHADEADVTAESISHVFLGQVLTPEEYRESSDNLAAFFRVLSDWDDREKAL